MNPFKKVKKLIDEKVSDVNEKKDKVAKLKMWQEKFISAKNQTNMDIYDTREKLYLGTSQVLPNANSTKYPTKLANNVINIHYEFAETMVDSTIPQPSVRNRRFAFSDQAKMIEDSIKNDLTDIEIDRINDMNERTTQIQGFSMVLVEWNPDFINHLYRGELRLRNIHPKQFVGQPGVYIIEDMDYFFLLFSVTKLYIKTRYDKDVDSESELYPEINSLPGLESNAKYNTLNDKVTEVVCFYKDEDGDVGKYVFCGDTDLEDLPKYFHRKLTKCKKCGNGKDDCECKNPKYYKESMDGEVLDSDTQIANGEVIPEGETVPFFSPKMYPVAVRINIPNNFAFGGQSDVDIVKDQQDAIKKMTTAIEEKILKGGSFITAPDTMPIQLTNQLYQIIKGSPQELASIRNINLEANVQQDLEVIKFMYDSARNTLGITNSFQGRQDPTALSGKAKQLNIQQSSGRLQSKLFNKYIFYKRLFEIMFNMKLAFYDELRPFVYKDENGKDQYGDFNKYMFIDRDSAGELYYVTDFTITADAGAGLPKDKMWLLDMYMNLYGQKIITPIQLLKVLSDLQLPGAPEMLKQAEDLQQNQQQAMADQQLANYQGTALPGAQPGAQPGMDMMAQQQQQQQGLSQGVIDQSQGQGEQEGQPEVIDQGTADQTAGQPAQGQQEQQQELNSAEQGLSEEVKAQVLEYLHENMSDKEVDEFLNAPDDVKRKAIAKALQDMGLPIPPKFQRLL